MRGRNRGGGKGPNPLSRTYESNGPDVKIRGTAQHIAEKYLQLARDAQASGDPVTAESYHQHAEHYLRLIAAAQEQFRQQNPHYRPFESQDGDMDEGDDDQPFGQGGPQPDVRFPGAAIEGEVAEGAPQPRGFREDRGYGRDGQQPREHREFQPRENRDYQPRENRDRDYQPRENREFQPRDRNDQPRENRDGQPREHREFQPRENRDFQGQGQGRREDRFPRRGPRPDRPAPAAEGGDVQPAGLPAFITAPVRTPVVSEAEPEAPVAAAPVAGAEDGEAGRFPLRPRRRRTRRADDEAAPLPASDDAPAGE